jgi:predicted nucleic acid-binding protein
MSGPAVADTSPLNYLVLIESVDLLPRMFSRVFIPGAVKRELTCADTPPAVRSFVESPPPWLSVVETQNGLGLGGLDDGEAEAIQIALDLGISTLLIDERNGYRVATSLGLEPVGLLGLLEFAAKNGWISFDEVIARLRRTTFRLSEKLITEVRQRLASSG